MVVPGTTRDALFILDTLLNLDAGPRPEVVTTDNASYSDMVVGVFAILNYRFAPRFADLPDQRYWRAALPDPLPDGVELSPEQQAIRGLRVAGSLVSNQIRAYDELRMFGRAEIAAAALALLPRTRCAMGSSCAGTASG